MKKYITILILTLVITTSCNNYLDVNTDPDTVAAEQITDPRAILPAAELNLANTIMGWEFGFNGAFYSEYWTAAYTHAQFKSACQYEPVSMSTAYLNLTGGVLTDLKKIDQLSSVNEEYKGYAYIAEALSIYTWQIMTDVWGDIPYTEAIKGDEGIYSPKFDDGKSIYTDLLVRINKLSAVNVSDYSISKNSSDFIFDGDFGQWKLFVNSLKLKLMMRTSETDLYNNADMVNFVASNSFLEESAKISGDVWSDGQEGKRHPMREFEEGEAAYVSKATIACRTFTDYLSSKNDEREKTLFTDVDGAYVGAYFGDFNSKKDSNSNGTDDDKEEYSIPKFEADTDIILLSNWEVSFFIAEINARNSNEAAAKLSYEKGVQQSYTQHKITTPVPTDLDWKTGKTIEENIEQIAMQKWVANAKYQHIESFLERNRTRYPALDKVDIKADRNAVNIAFPIGKLTLSVAGRVLLNDKLPESATYPASILTRNVNAPSQKANMAEKVWWNKKSND
ncbi:SusD/RagB family nutrient-binding outer membrane lipoprotein [Polaribacter sp. Q13]|uniref:SusD/RagB family nutrient-binding outer membrane lipoprotein n=1 Tax=Polaribacter sp. Q13 TaxID=2806551 RepID=UPI00193B26A9|nr:SusD/RagB family nutrient-binding outer membrane lipoprotein [Polaribacter sp. Q13]QVY65361.1 SusD/RagB family nutrient-binding outer membrane lipoprotein [Polaribacter sp. Q13]